MYGDVGRSVLATEKARVGLGLGLGLGLEERCTLGACSQSRHISPISPHIFPTSPLYLP